MRVGAVTEDGLDHKGHHQEPDQPEAGEDPADPPAILGQEQQAECRYRQAQVGSGGHHYRHEDPEYPPVLACGHQVGG